MNIKITLLNKFKIIFQSLNSKLNLSNYLPNKSFPRVSSFVTTLDPGIPEGLSPPTKKY